MWTSPIVMFLPEFEHLSNVLFVDGNHEVQAFSACCSDKSFTIGIRLGRSVGSLQDRQPQGFQRRVQVLGINTVAIMNDESVSFIARNTFSELLQRPIRRRVACDIEMKESSRIDFHDEDDLDQLERRGHNNEAIASVMALA